MKNRSSTTCAALLLASFAGTASADVVNMSFLGTGQGTNVKATFFGTDQNVFVGQLRHSITGGDGQAASLVGGHRTFCADFEQHVSGNTSVFTVKAPADLLVRGTALGTGKAGALTDLFSAFGGSATAAGATSNLGAAFQMLVWEILYDFDPGQGAASISLTAGNMQFKKTDGTALSTTLVNQFNTLVASIGSGNVTGSLFGLQSSARQDQLIYGSNLIPAPGAAMVALLGAAAFCPRRRRAAH